MAKVIIQVGLEADVYQRIEQLRGDASRASFINDLLKRLLEGGEIPKKLEEP